MCGSDGWGVCTTGVWEREKELFERQRKEVRWVWGQGV